MTETFALPNVLQEKWTGNQFDQPTAIQTATYDDIVSGESLLGVAPTGSGKTLAFLLPSLVRLHELGNGIVLILAPSQELALQIAEVARDFGQAYNFKTLAVIGGGSVKRQQEKLKVKPEIIVGTPGRVLELLSAKKIKWSQIQTLILDEVDQLLREENNLTEKILNYGIADFQLLGFSATATSHANVEKVFAGQKKVDVTSSDTSQGDVAERYLVGEARKKIQSLKRLAQVPGMKGLVFFNQVADLGAAHQKLTYEGVAVASLASDEDKFARKAALTAFKEGSAQLLLTTDVAARGIDLPELPFVIFFDSPTHVEQYTHRKGRTGRMGTPGNLLIFVEPHQVSSLAKFSPNFAENWLYGGQLVDVSPKKMTQQRDYKKSK